MKSPRRKNSLWRKRLTKELLSQFFRSICYELDIKLELIFFREFDPGSGRTLAACLTHASRTEFLRNEASADFCLNLVADG